LATTYAQLVAHRKTDMPFAYTKRDSMLYALSVGMGRDPLNQRDLQYVFEQNPLRTLPTQACVVARTALLINAGLDRAKVLHGEQRLVVHKPLPAEASLLASSWVSGVLDKGKDKGCLIDVETAVRDAQTGEELFSIITTTFARGDGGIGGPGGAARPIHAMPERQPDQTILSETRPDQALLYRLNGDLNPLHADPLLAARVGFKAPILHGLCTYGIACREIVAHVCDYDHTRIRAFDVRFTSPVYPGETVATDLWVDGGVVSFRCRVAERDVTVLNNGRCVLGTTSQHA
jgi:acyl dehydratase